MEEPAESEIPRDILLACRRGNARAFRHVVEKLMRPAYRHALALTGNHADALDVSQEAFVKAWRAISDYDPARPFYPWFYTILKRIALNLLRHRKANPGASPEKLFDPPDPGYDPDGQQREELVLGVRTVLAALSAEDREIICLRDMHDYSYKELSAMLGIPIGTVMSRLYSARIRFRKLMQESGYVCE